VGVVEAGPAQAVLATDHARLLHDQLHLLGPRAAVAVLRHPGLKLPKLLHIGAGVHGPVRLLP
jgi:hypothetical protein